MAVSIDEVKHIAELAKLKFSDDELADFTREFNGILEYMNTLNEADTENVEPLTHPNENVNVFREDVPAPSTPQDEALKNAPETDGTYFIVPKIINTGPRK